MLRLRYLSWLVICAVLFSTVAPALPAHAASIAAVIPPIRQDDVAERIADIRSEEPDLEEDFSSAGGLFETLYEGTTVSYLKSGELRIAVDDENTLAWSTLNQEVADFYMEVETIHYEGSLNNQFGILARFDEEGNYYLFAAGSDGYYTIQRRVDGEWEVIVDWTESEFIEFGEGGRNTLGLLAEGDTYTFLINDHIIDEIVDDTINGTTLALNAAAFSDPPIDIGFDNFRLWYVGDPIEQEPRRAPVDARGITGTVEPPETVEPPDTPTEEPAPEPTSATTPEPTDEPTEEPTAEPTAEPTTEVAPEPTGTPTVTAGTSSDPTIAAIQGQPPTFSDDFEDGDTSDWQHFPTDAVIYEIFEGALEFVFSSSNLLTWSEPPVSATNYYIEVDATIVSPVEAAEYGIIFNYEDSQNFYFYAVNNASRYSIWRLVNNGWEIVQDWADSDVLLSGEGNTNRLGLLVQETTVVATANDDVLAEVDTGEVLSGGVALAAGTFDEADLIVSFDNVLFWDLDATEPSPTGEPTEEVEPTTEPTAEPADEPITEDFAAVTARIAEITASEPDAVDDFRRDMGYWDVQTFDEGEFYYESRAFHIESFVEERITWSTYYGDPEAIDPMELEDFYVEFDTSFVIRTGENAAGLVFRMSDSDNFYKFVLDEIGYYQLQKRVNGQYTDIISWDVTDVANEGEGTVNRIGILAEGSTLAFTVNGVVIAQAEDTDLDSGAIALAIQTYSTPEGHSTFDNFELWNLSE